MASDCQQELCPNWTGDGDFCPCAAFGLQDAHGRPITLNPATWPGMTIRLDDEQLRAERTRVVEQFTAALLTGLDDLERDDHWGTPLRPGDVQELIARVALELGHG